VSCKGHIYYKLLQVTRHPFLLATYYLLLTTCYLHDYCTEIDEGKTIVNDQREHDKDTIGPHFAETALS
jgi:hypothetical protein